jgi:bacterioferritin
MAMQGDPAVIRLLNTVLTNELTSVNQYFLHARMFQNWGFARLGKVVYDESIEEMKHADKMIKRVLFLDALPNLQDLHKLSIGETVIEAMQADLALEIAGRATLVEGVTLCERLADFVSRELLVDILSDTEEHIDFLEAQLALARSLGEHNYLQSAMGELED